MSLVFNTFNRLRSFSNRNLTVSQIAAVILVPFFLWLMLTQPFFVAPLIAAGLFLLGLVARYPHYGLFMMVLSVPVQDKFAPSIGGGQSLTVTQAMVLLTLTGWFINRCTYRKLFLAKPAPPMFKWLALYIFTMILSLATAFSIPAGLNEISRWLITLFAYVLATGVIENRRQFWQFVGFLLAGGLFEAALGISQTARGAGPESFAINQDLSRAYGTFVFPNPYAGYLEMSLPLVVALGFFGLKLRNLGMKNWLAKAGQPRQAERKVVIRAYQILVVTAPWAAIMVVAILASYSRGSWLGLVAGSLVMVAVRGKKSIGLGLLIIALVVVGYFAIETGAVSPSIATRISGVADMLQPFDVRDVKPNDENYAVVERMAMWQAGGNMYLYNSWLGVGIGNFDTVYNKFNAPDWIYSRGHAHNYYINAAAETGSIGAAAYLLLVLSIFGHAWKTVRQTKDQAFRYVAWGGIGIITSVIVHNIVENLHVLNLGIQWMGVIALFYLIRKFDGEKSPPESPDNVRNPEL